MSPYIESLFDFLNTHLHSGSAVCLVGYRTRDGREADYVILPEDEVTIAQIVGRQLAKLTPDQVVAGCPGATLFAEDPEAMSSARALGLAAEKLRNLRRRYPYLTGLVLQRAVHSERPERRFELGRVVTNWIQNETALATFRSFRLAATALTTLEVGVFDSEAFVPRHIFTPATVLAASG